MYITQTDAYSNEWVIASGYLVRSDKYDITEREEYGKKKAYFALQVSKDITNRNDKNIFISRYAFFTVYRATTNKLQYDALLASEAWTRIVVIGRKNNKANHIMVECLLFPETVLSGEWFGNLPKGAKKQRVRKHGLYSETLAEEVQKKTNNIKDSGDDYPF